MPIPLAHDPYYRSNRRPPFPHPAQSTGMKRPPEDMAGGEGVEHQADIKHVQTSSVTSPGTLEYSKFEISNRGELIESIKRGESPTWIPNHSVSGSLETWVNMFRIISFLFQEQLPRASSHTMVVMPNNSWSIYGKRSLTPVYPHHTARDSNMLAYHAPYTSACRIQL